MGRPPSGRATMRLVRLEGELAAGCRGKGKVVWVQVAPQGLGGAVISRRRRGGAVRISTRTADERERAAQRFSM